MTAVRHHEDLLIERASRRMQGFAAAALFCAFAVGCQTTTSSLAWWKRDDRDLASVDNIRGPLQRILEGRKSDEDRYNASLSPAEGLEEYEAAHALYEKGQYAKAERRLKHIAKKYKNSPVAEDALYLLAESQFKRKDFGHAQDTYGRLMKEFPSTRYMSESTGRLFEIARIWLDFPKVVTSGEVQQVNLENPTKTPPPKSDGPKTRDPSKTLPLVPNMWDRTRPVFDTEGRALEALKSIWLNDPTGPLADDALMLTASHYLREGNYEEADHVYETLRKEYAKSPHFENSVLLGAHTKLMSYQGPEYDDTGLSEAEKLTESAIRIFPNHPDRERLLDEARRIEAEKAKGVWEEVRYWQRRRRPAAVAIYCKELLKEYPTSEYAPQARQLLRKIDPSTPSVAQPQPPADESALGRVRVNDEPAEKRRAPATPEPEAPRLLPDVDQAFEP
jgi:TolA-binding protein